MSHQAPRELTPRAIILAIVLALPEAAHFGGWLGLLMLAAVAMLRYRLAVRSS